jgi:hypothetical protein
MIKKIIKFFIAALFLTFCLFKTNQIREIVGIFQSLKKEINLTTHTNDERTYLKIFYLMKKGLNYYQANYLAFQANLETEATVWTKDVWGWRLPFVFYFWKTLAKNGGEIMLLFCLFSLIFLFCAYLLAKKFVPKKLALFAPGILFPYFLNALISGSFLFISWWALFFFTFGLTFFFYRRHRWATIFFTLAVISRELFLIPLGSMFLIALIYKKNKSVFSLPLIIFLFVIAFHYHQVSQFVSLENPWGIQKRFMLFNKGLLLSSLAFSTNNYLFVSLRPSLIWIIFSLLGLGYLVFKTNRQNNALIALSSFLPFFLSLPFIGQTVWQDYWGIIYVPLAGIFSLSVFTLFKQSRSLNKG